MYKSPGRRFFRVFVIFWIAAIIIFILIYGIFFSPLSPFHQCTLIGCSDMLQLTLTHEPPGEYTILLTSSTGETRSVTCIPGENALISPPKATCRKGIVTIYSFAATEVTVKITWNGGSYTTTGKPTITTLRPNGLFCPPTCQSGKMSITLP